MLSTGFASTARWRMARRVGTLMAGACVLAACTTGTKAPVVDMSGTKSPEPAPVAAAGSASSYVIRPEGRLYSIARAQKMSWQDVARMNGITDPSQLRVGQSLQVSPQGAGPSVMPPATAVAQAEPIGGVGVQQRPLDGAST